MRHLRKPIVVLIVLGVLCIFGSTFAGAQAASPAAGSAIPADAFVYHVLPGDTVAPSPGALAPAFGPFCGPIPGIHNPDLIHPGQRVIVPLPPDRPPTFSQVKVALVAVGGAGGVGCGDSIVLVNRPVVATTMPLTAAIRELLSIKDQHYGQSGLHNALYASNLRLESVTVSNARATIRLTGQLSLGGVCDDPRVIAQFEQTGRQFATVQQVEVFVNAIPLQTLLSEKGA